MTTPKKESIVHLLYAPAMFLMPQSTHRFQVSLAVPQTTAIWKIDVATTPGMP